MTPRDPTPIPGRLPQEPVALAGACGARVSVTENGQGTLWALSTQGLERLVQQARNQAYEHAARACEDLGFAEHGPGRQDSEAYDCADRIRGLIEDPRRTASDLKRTP